MDERNPFVEQRSGRWDRLEQRLLSSRTAAHWSELAELYRGVCADLSLARSRDLPADIQNYLDDLAGRAHNRLYGVRQRKGFELLRMIAVGFPVELRKNWRYFLAANLVFYGPMGVIAGLSLLDPSYASLVVDEYQLEVMAEMYSRSDLRRAVDQDVQMAGHYVMNNVGIAFRSFATGALFGLGPIFSLLFNGLSLGAIMGYLGAVGLGGNLGEFIVGHGPWELTSLVVAGTAGLRLGAAMVVTQGRTRVGSVQAAAPILFRLMVGAAVMMLIAAMIEGFWSAGPVPRVGKYIFGAVQAAIIALWLGFGGRGTTP